MICVWLSRLFIKPHLLSPILGAFRIYDSLAYRQGKVKPEFLRWFPYSRRRASRICKATGHETEDMSQVSKTLGTLVSWGDSADLPMCYRVKVALLSTPWASVTF